MKSSRASLHVLIVLAQPHAGHRALRNGLPGVDVRFASSGEARRELASLRADVLIVDGGIAGFADFIAEARSVHVALPIFFAALSLEHVSGAAAAGANDFAVPEATPAEIAVRVKLLSSASVRPLPQLRPVGTILLDREARLLMSGSKRVALSPIELKMFERLLLDVGQPVARAALERSVWSQHEGGERGTNVAVVYVSYLRKKLARLGDACRIVTITNVGYALMVKDRDDRPTRPRARLAPSS